MELDKGCMINAQVNPTRSASRQTFEGTLSCLGFDNIINHNMIDIVSLPETVKSFSGFHMKVLFVPGVPMSGACPFSVWSPFLSV